MIKDLASRMSRFLAFVSLALAVCMAWDSVGWNSAWARTVARSAVSPAANLDSVFGDVRVNSPACFFKIYSADELRRRPSQSVIQMKVKLRRITAPPEDGAPATDPGEPILALQVKLRGQNPAKTWTNNITCFNDVRQSSVRCSVECDGGSVEVLERKQKQKSGPLVLKNNGVLLYGDCGDDNGDGQHPPGQDDRVFLRRTVGGDDLFTLPQVAPSECTDVSEEIH